MATPHYTKIRNSFGWARYDPPSLGLWAEHARRAEAEVFYSHSFLYHLINHFFCEGEAVSSNTARFAVSVFELHMVDSLLNIDIIYL